VAQQELQGPPEALLRRESRRNRRKLRLELTTFHTSNRMPWDPPPDSVPSHPAPRTSLRLGRRPPLPGPSEIAYPYHKASWDTTIRAVVWDLTWDSGPLRVPSLRFVVDPRW